MGACYFGQGPIRWQRQVWSDMLTVCGAGKPPAAAGRCGVPPPSDAACPFLGTFQEWVETLEKDENVWDQNAYNDLMRRGSRPLPERADRLFE